MSLRNDAASSTGSLPSSRAASAWTRWKRAASNDFCAPRPITSTRRAVMPAGANSTVLLPPLPVMSPLSTSRLIAPSAALSMRAAALLSTPPS